MRSFNDMKGTFTELTGSFNDTKKIMTEFQ